MTAADGNLRTPHSHGFDGRRLGDPLANPSAGVPVPVATETRRSRIVCIARGERPFRYWWLDPVCKHGPRTHADLQVVTPGCDPV